MTPHVAKVAFLVETASRQAAPSTDPVPEPQAVGASVGPDLSDYRLTIAQDPESGTFVYRVLDRRTGEVIRQLPREELLRWRRDPKYAAGALIDARA
ncbi:flagellar protein FlaG [Caulobacter sp. 17J65-9]|uniref:flagellar protein FlaG n=1 Tax=Caulobacter sp. 17J65-9 TaxID=2709382 RepID=UPI0013CC1244|nr:flagellar protein FlaG [Caulobacter sp. 17J65-9]NEX93693.1 flagellar protein FlaG [Caulobacter sp. 17J65-9]